MRRHGGTCGIEVWTSGGKAAVAREIPCLTTVVLKGWGVGRVFARGGGGLAAHGPAPGTRPFRLALLSSLD